MQTPLSIPGQAICQACGVPAPTKYVEFYQNVGALIMRFHRSIKGNLCRACIDEYFWNFTGKTFLLGWWGIISVIVTPFMLINNVFRFMASRSVPRPPIQLGPGPSPFWVFCTMAGGFLTVALACSILFPSLLGQ